MENKLFVGIDPSLTGTGVFLLYGDKYDGKIIKTVPSKFSCSISRCDYISELIINFIDEKLKMGLDLSMICSEDYFTGINGGTVIQLAELSTLIRYKILKRGFPFAVVAPKKLKKFVTGNGNSKKNVMLKAVFKKWEYDLSDDNIADASGLANFAKKVYMIHNDSNSVELLQYEKDVFREYMDKDCLIKL